MRYISLLPISLILFSPCIRSHAQQDASGATHSAKLPKHAANTYAFLPFADTLAERRQAFLELHMQNPGNGPYSEAIRISMGSQPNEAPIRGALDNMDARKDCSDFRLHGILRLLFQFGDSPLLSEEIRQQSRESILKYKYWPDEPGIDSMCTWSENHHIMFAAGGYLAGQLFPDEVFTNSGQTGREKMAVCRPRVLRWLDLRFRAGFSEWLSNVYYNEDMPPVLNLIDFAQDTEVAQRATMVMDLLIADMALNSFHGAFGSTHGRTYEKEKKWPFNDHTGSAQKLLFGMNRFSVGNMTASCLALSDNYRMPRVFHEIATDFNRPEIVNRQRMSIRIKDAKKWGLDTKRIEDGMTFLSLEAYAHPKTINLMARMMDEYNWWENEFFEGFNDNRPLIEKARKWHVLPFVARYYRHDLTRNMRPEVNIYTYRTPDYMLSSAQDYRKGYGGDQQHIWQATLGPEATCFTTNPAQHEKEGRGHGSPGYWTGSGVLPRVAQTNNVAIVVYKIRDKGGLYLKRNTKMTHAWFPRDKFDEVIERDNWLFGRLGDGYLALWSREPHRWQTEDGEDKGRELIADGPEHIWICEMGRQGTDGPFSEFVERISAAPVKTTGLKVRYQSPSQGRLEFGWRGAFRQNGRRVTLDAYPRYGNPYCDAPFPGGAIAFRHHDEWLRLNWETLERDASSFCDR